MDGYRKTANAVIAAVFLAVTALAFVCLAPARLYDLLRTVRDGGLTKEYTSALESDTNASFPKKDYFIDLNGLFHRLLLQREMNGVVLLENGIESECMSERNEEEIAANAASVKKLSAWLEARGISFLYCQIPMKNDPENNLLPEGLTDHSDRVADAFVQALRNDSVNCLDLRDCMRADGIERSSLYLRTEHHWSPAGGFYAFQKICGELSERFGEDIPGYVTDLANYRQTTYKRSSLGYFGQRTGWIFGGFDDFTLIYPGWETKQSSWAPHKELLREGSFSDAIFYTEYLDAPWRERGLYGIYIGGDWPVVVHHSETAPIDKTLMILIDSYGTIPEAFLTTAYQNVVALDLRWVKLTGMETTTVDFVEEYDPDIVIVAFNPNQLGSAGSEQFQYGLPD